ncbi:DUF3006 domain-containing protein [Oceanobacillus piezotolerans]|uniref:DUF3006 domain-containing protein n=1 Tax=Oceanobacillus piezotolerans TaxID=2448030 RepID=A0A498DR33_9BACI|nr:DUF3006 family protein [Oceanobacillus piezotolerans]RLL46929.1 DUF3006 domain-containing protein [Oceanobacillus piezotolerans]
MLKTIWVMAFTLFLCSVFWSILTLKEIPNDETHYGTYAHIIYTKGVLDRLEGEHAIILLETVNEEMIVHKSRLPYRSKEETWFYIKKRDGAFRIIGIDNTQTILQKKRSLQLVQLAKYQELNEKMNIQ